MIVYDPIYGRFNLPEYLSELVATPEFRRLGQVRLLNTATSSMPTLGEIRRFSHTLGVVHLSRHVQLDSFSESDRRALEASAILHDIATPPFGHLFEYFLKETHGWTHEAAIQPLLRGLHVPENSAHQVFAGRPLRFRQALERCEISADTVEAIVRGKHALSQLLFGQVDLDNLDNVARMSWALGIAGPFVSGLALAGGMKVTALGDLELTSEAAVSGVAAWARVRRACYDVIVFDPTTVASQAVLWHAIDVAMKEEVIGAPDWSLTDEDFLLRLAKSATARRAIQHQYYGKLPHWVFTLHLQGTLKELGLESRRVAADRVRETLSASISSRGPLGYVFVDNGAFEKELALRVAGQATLFRTGVRSSSVVLYGFVASPAPPKAAECHRAVSGLMEALGNKSHLVLKTLTPYNFASNEDRQLHLF